VIRREERESKSIRNLRGGWKVVRCERQGKIAFNLAFNMEAVFRIRKDRMIITGTYNEHNIKKECVLVAFIFILLLSFVLLFVSVINIQFYITSILFP